MSFTAGIAHTFTSTVLQAGSRLVLAKNPAAFSTRHDATGIVLVAWDSGNLARKGETLSPVTPSGSNILTFTYSNIWYPSTYTPAVPCSPSTSSRGHRAPPPPGRATATP